MMKVVALLFGVLDNSWVELRNTLWIFAGLLMREGHASLPPQSLGRFRDDYLI